MVQAYSQLLRFAYSGPKLLIPPCPLLPCPQRGTCGSTFWGCPVCQRLCVLLCGRLVLTLLLLGNPLCWDMEDPLGALPLAGWPVMSFSCLGCEGQFGYPRVFSGPGESLVWVLDQCRSHSVSKKGLTVLCQGFESLERGYQEALLR